MKCLSRKPHSVDSKGEFYQLYESPLFREIANTALTWNTYQDVLDSEWKGRVCMRSKKHGTRSKPAYNLKVSEVPTRMRNWGKRFGILESEITFNESMPDKKLRIQGELTTHPNWQVPLLRFSTIKKPMLLALEEEDLEAKGMKALAILQANLWDEDYQTLIGLVEMFPGNAIEFSSYSIDIGRLPGRNSVIWEVRNY